MMERSDLPFNHNAYEVAKSIGFEIDTETKDGRRKRIAYRADIIRMLGSQQYTVMLWQVHGEMGNIVALSVEAGSSAIVAETVDEAVEQFLKAVNASGVISAPGDPAEEE
jgi:hypothetical protein